MHRGYYLCIGLNRLSKKHYGDTYKPLRGAQNDAREMQGIAESRGFRPLDPVRPILIGSRATLHAVDTALRAACRTLQKGDTLLLTFSGHGGMHESRNLGGFEEEQTETWCLYDTELFDLELGEMWTRFRPGVRILVISDSCNSGTVILQFRARESTESLSKVASRLGAIKTLDDVARVVALRTGQTDYEKRLAGAMRRAKAESETKARVLLLAACQETGGARDASPEAKYPLGLFTKQLLSVWEGGRFPGSYQQFIDRIARLVAEIEPGQVPRSAVRPQGKPGFISKRPFSR